MPMERSHPRGSHVDPLVKRSQIHRDPKQWQKIRRRILVDGESKRRVLKETGIHWATLDKILAHPLPTPRGRTKRLQQGDPDRERVIAAIRDAAGTIDAGLSVIPESVLPRKCLGNLALRLAEHGLCVKPETPVTCSDREAFTWMLSVMQGAEKLPCVQKLLGGTEQLPLLLRNARDGKLKLRNRALTVLGRLRGFSLASVARFLRISSRAARQYWLKYRAGGVGGLFTCYKIGPRMADDEQIRAEVFSVLHSPPSDHGFNRTSWKRDDLIKCLRERGVHVCRDVIAQILRAAGYRWRKAKVVLTSNDPAYREKLARIQSILSTLREDERFFSVDEFGPFSVKAKGGKRLVGPHEYPHVPQFQKSKGRLIITAGLELSRNQMTHFYSEHKDTREMIKLIKILRRRYKSCAKLYISWDSASWHVSDELKGWVAAVNPSVGDTKGPVVELVPLPSSAQFLNVIESVFSGMARAVIHNSDYDSVEEAKVAIDRHFRERNAYFRRNPRRAGKKIWGKERVPPVFSESANCKEPKWR